MRLSEDDSIGKVSLVEVPGARLAVFVSGGTRDSVILLHGGPGVPDYLAEVAEILAPRHQVIRYDQRGTGRSTSHDGRFGLAEHVEDLEAIRKAYGHERLNLFGHSWGGTLAQLYAQRYPKRVSKLFLCDSGLGLGDSAPPPDESWLVFEASRCTGPAERRFRRKDLH